MSILINWETGKGKEKGVVLHIYVEIEDFKTSHIGLAGGNVMYKQRMLRYFDIDIDTRHVYFY